MDGAIVADVQALPVDISTPGAFTITASARAPAIRMLDVFGSLGEFLPFIVTSGIDCIILASKSSLSLSCLTESLQAFACHNLAGLAKPNYSRHVERATAQVVFLTTSIQDPPDLLSCLPCGH